MSLHDSLENVKLVLIITLLIIVLVLVVTSWSSVINFLNNPLVSNTPSDNGMTNFIKQVNDFLRQFFKR